MKVLAIDPGDLESAYVLWDGENSKILEFDKIDNILLLDHIYNKKFGDCYFVIEMVASYGMPVGKNVFETVFWIGRFYEAAIKSRYLMTGSETPGRMYRTEVKMNICHQVSAKDGNIITALIDRFGDRNSHGKYAKGTNKNPGFFFGFSKDVWQSFALAVTFYDNLK